jgi:membrane fusion protein (multidrug efflux system)
VARTDTVVDAILATGTIEAVQSIELRPEVQGRLTEIPASEGTEVAAGTPLFKVDDAELRALVAQLTAERDRATQALERTKELISQNAASAADLEDAEATARSRQAQLELQQVRLERTVVRAPFAGVVGQRFVSLGDYVTPSTRLTTLQTVDPQRAAFQVPERYAERLSRGQSVTFRVAAVDREFTGTVDFVDPLVQVPARTILVKALVRNPRRLLKPGMFVEARLSMEVRPAAIVIPEDAIMPLEGSDFVWVAADGTVSRRPVTLGVRSPGFVEVREGLAAGEQVVVGGLQRLFEGAPVTAIPTGR